MGQGKIKRENERLRDEVVKWAIQFVEAPDGAASQEYTALSDAVLELKRHQAVRAPDAPADPNAFTCPHCDRVRPPYGWTFNQVDSGPFAVSCLTCFCYECKAILSVCVVGFMPKGQLDQALKDQFAKRLQI